MPAADGDRFHISDVTDDLEPPPRHRGGYAMRASGTLTDRRLSGGVRWPRSNGRFDGPAYPIAAQIPWSAGPSVLASGAIGGGE